MVRIANIPKTIVPNFTFFLNKFQLTLGFSEETGNERLKWRDWEQKDSGMEKPHKRRENVKAEKAEKEW